MESLFQEHSADCAQAALSTWDPAAQESLPEHAADCARAALSAQDPAAMESLPEHAADCAQAALSTQDPAAMESLPGHAADCARAALSARDPAATEETTVQAWVAGQGLDAPQTGSPSSGLCPLPETGSPSSEGARREQVRRRFLKAGSLPGHRLLLVLSLDA